MPHRPVLSPALVAVQFAKPLRNITALHDAGIRAADSPLRSHAPRRPAFAPRRKAAALWDEGNAAKCAGSLKIYRTP